MMLVLVLVLVLAADNSRNHLPREPDSAGGLTSVIPQHSSFDRFVI